MNKITRPILIFLLALAIISCNKSVAQNSSKREVKSPFHLVWSDEFNGSSVDTTIWKFETGASGWGNHEQEFYQPENATEEDGNLIITANKQPGSTHPYTSARMRTLGTKAFKYGKIEARIKLPVGQGFWPAFWMLGDNINSVPWPASGEIDIMEHINTDSVIYGTIHWDSIGHVQNGGHVNTTPNAFHLYGIEWDADSIKWFIDDNVYHSAAITHKNMEEFQRPFFILFNFAVGGDWPGQKIEDSLLPAKMYVDFVRVYQK
jgi:beta-glucanase (GH16 family)